MPLFPLEIFFSVCCANIFGFHVLQGLINAVQKIWPDSEHRFCVRHMLQNFQKAGHKGETLKNDLWAIARSTNIPKWEKNMQKLQADSPAAYEWVEQLVPNTWIKAFFKDFSKCDMLLNNHSEVFNRYYWIFN
jgi:transposase-like protein